MNAESFAATDTPNMQQKTTLLNLIKTLLLTTTKLLLATGMISLAIIVAACVKVVSLLSKVFDLDD